MQGGRIREGRKHAFLGPPTWFVWLPLLAEWGEIFDKEGVWWCPVQDAHEVANGVPSEHKRLAPHAQRSRTPVRIATPTHRVRISSPDQT